MFIAFALFFGMIAVYPSQVSAQEEITVEDLYKKGTFRQNYVYGLASMSDGISYTELNMSRNAINKKSYETGEKLETVFAAKDFENEEFNWIFDYQFSADESKLLISAVSYTHLRAHET